MQPEQAAATVSGHYGHGAGAPYVEELRSAERCGPHMVVTRQPPADASMPAFAELVVSQAIRHPFRYLGDFGAGKFRGRALPMDFVVIPPRVSGRAAIHDRNDLRFLGIPVGMACHCLGRDVSDQLDFGAVHARHHRDPLIGHALEALWHELAEGENGCRLYVDTLTAAIVVHLQRIAEDQTRSLERRGGLAPRESARVIEYMRAYLDRPITLRDLAGVAGLSPYHFARAFRDALGLPPHQYLIRMRIERARELLAETNWTVTEVALATGYSAQQFARHFRRRVGCTPSAYRRERAPERWGARANDRGAERTTGRRP